MYLKAVTNFLHLISLKFGVKVLTHFEAHGQKLKIINYLYLKKVKDIQKNPINLSSGET